MNFGQWSSSRRLGVKKCEWEHRLNKELIQWSGAYAKWKTRKRRDMDSRDAETGKAFELPELKNFNFISF
ncbi:hypothetical protein N7519_008950 [Penicillium mononematosum]|uniref:uncharacterized protein n=1 Tax=Penicillium mononematosum TaxID=268346 RepID=UPI0025475314|nr:uncharacterized protein N7519_008950 [Penicillium mononematosum]KAJ6178489.1 hypothetical protein N7519_008950 [Penicillium mononematosum]